MRELFAVFSFFLVLAGSSSYFWLGLLGAGASLALAYKQLRGNLSRGSASRAGASSGA